MHDPRAMDVGDVLANAANLSDRPVRVIGILVIGKGQYIESLGDRTDPARLYRTSDIRLRIFDVALADAVDGHADPWLDAAWAYKV